MDAFEALFSGDSTIDDRGDNDILWDQAVDWENDRLQFNDAQSQTASTSTLSVARLP